MTPPGSAAVPDEPQLFSSFSAQSDQQRQAKRALEKLRSAFNDTPLAQTIEGVLKGDRSISELMRDPQMVRVLEQTSERIQEEKRRLPPEKLDELKKEYGL